MTQPRTPIKIGILGAARIASRAIIFPAHATEHVLYAVASRDRVRGEAFAKQYGVEKVYDSYQAIIDDPRSQQFITRYLIMAMLLGTLKLFKPANMS